MSKKFKRFLGLVLVVVMLLPMASVYAGEQGTDEEPISSGQTASVSEQESNPESAPEEPPRSSTEESAPEVSPGSSSGETASDDSSGTAPEESESDESSGSASGGLDSEEPPESTPEESLPDDSGENETGEPEEPLPEEPEAQELCVKLTAGARYAFANRDTIDLTLHISGGAPEYSAVYSVKRDGSGIATSVPTAAIEGENSYSYAPTAFGTHAISVSVTDGQGQTASASVEIPVAERDTTSAAQQLRLAQSVTLTGNWRQDLLLVARTQLGYRESDRDFIIDSEGKRQGYTVYGDWYGMPYEEWCAMFVAYCSNYAGIPAKYFPQDAGCAKLLAAMRDLGAYRSAASGYEPQAGDLVFFNWDAEPDPDHVGIVEAVAENRIETIEGNNSRSVARDSYARGDSRIMGYVDVDALYARAYGEPEPEGRHLVLEFRFNPVGYAAIAMPYALDISQKALQLKMGSNLSKITLSYQEGDNWVEIKDGSSDLPADRSYMFEFTYKDISVKDLLEADGQMVYEKLPDWFNALASGTLLYGRETAARIEVVDGVIVINFLPDWLDAHAKDTLSGTFSVRGNLDWRKFPGDGQDMKVPDTDVTMSFEQNLAQKYGNVEIEKSEPELVSGENGEYYLKYELTVTNGEDMEMADVTVKDLFANAAYIMEYVGVKEDDQVLAAEGSAEGYLPEEVRGEAVRPGSVRMDGAYMLWTIGTLRGGEVRKLIYYARIDDSATTLNNIPIQNQAEVFAGEYPKDRAESNFQPKFGIQMAKKIADTEIGPEGYGTITYTIEITANDSNTFALKDISLKDALPADMQQYFKGSAEGRQADDVTVSISITAKDGTEAKQSGTLTVEDYANASFELELADYVLEPGDTMTITYTLWVDHIFRAGNSDISFTNTATVSKGNRTLRSAQQTKTLTANTWSRKFVGESLENDEYFDLPRDGVYHYNNGSIEAEANPPESFKVEKDSLKYQVVLNENGTWDLSETTLKDSIDQVSGKVYLRHTGYVQIEVFNAIPANIDTSGMSDAAVISMLRNYGLVQTVWLDIDNMTDFSFKPGELGLEKNCAIVMTYYATPCNMENIGSVMVTNRFQLEGQVGAGNGTVYLPAVEVSAGKVVEGGAAYRASKESWYYEPWPVYKTSVVGSRYSQTDWEKDYSGTGAIYWVIKLQGTIGTGTYKNGSPTAGSFYIYDKPDTQTQFKRDSLVGIYECPEDLDFETYASYADFAEEMKESKLEGNPMNDKFFSGGYDSTKAQYQWYCENTTLEAIVFPKGYTLQSGNALYIVLRTVPTDAMPAAGTVKVYTNNLSIASGGDKVFVDSASYIYGSYDELHKESKGAYLYDKDKDTFTSVSNRADSNWSFNQFVEKSELAKTGIYAVWLLNVNWAGNMQGETDVIDYLPKGMELVYVGVNNHGETIRLDPSKWPETTTISELNADSAWKEMIFTNAPNRGAVGVDATTITYYNPTTRQIRWHIKNLTRASAFGGKRPSYEINLRIVCKVEDPELFLNQQKTYQNEAAILDPETKEDTDTTYADVTISYPLDKFLDEDALKLLGASGNSDSLTIHQLRIPFQIAINPYGLEMTEGDTFPPLIDELSPGIELIVGSLRITADGKDFTNFSYTVENGEAGQKIIIQDLPDNTPLTIYYEVELTNPGEGVVGPISNTAYWAGYERPGEPQVKINEVIYDARGNVTATSPPTIQIIKVDAKSYSRLLSGAEFALYEVNENGEPKGDALRTGVTDSYGRILFENDDDDADQPKLKVNTVYSIVETKAPNGYTPITEPHYFVIVPTDETFDSTGYQVDVHVWQDSANYSVAIENPRTPIRVGKVFVNANGEEYTPEEGTYRFGLYSANDELLETLVIEYAGGVATYYLNNVQQGAPEFSKDDPEGAYKVYELDENGQPILLDDLVELNGAYYRVTYSDNYDDVIFGSNTVTVTNQYVATSEDLSLTISKKVMGDGAEQEKEFTFRVTLTAAEDPSGTYEIEGNQTAPAGNSITFTDGMAEVVLTHGQSITIKGLPAGVHYEVEEILGSNDKYDVSSSGETGDIQEDSRALAQFENRRIPLGELQISKIVTGTGADPNKAFSFRVVLTDANGDELEGEYDYEIVTADMVTPPGGEKGTLKSGDIVQLKHGETMIIYYLPAGAQYDVKELLLGQDGYTVTATDASGEIEDGKISEAKFVNYRNAQGELWISKTVTGTGADEDKAFSFRVVLTDANGDELEGEYDYEIVTADTVTPPGGEKGRIKSGNIVQLKHGETMIIRGLPAGAQYDVKELLLDQDGYTVTATNASGEIEDGEISEAKFVNHRDALGELRISKTVTGTDADLSKKFIFRVVLTDGDGKELRGKYPAQIVTADMPATSNGETAMELKSGDVVQLAHGEMIIIRELPAGAKFSVVEFDNEGYTVTVNGSSTDTAEGAIADGQIAEAAFVNNKDEEQQGDDPGEPAEPSPSPDATETEAPSADAQSDTDGGTPRTGDDSRLMLWLALLAVSAIGILAAFRKGGSRRRKNR